MKALLLILWSWLVSDPLYATGVVLVAVVMFWKALPAKLRVSVETRFPRAVGVVRAIVALVPDLVGAARVVRYQAIGGQSRVLVSDRAAAESDKLRDLLEADEPRPSEPGYVDHGLLAVVAGLAMLALGVALIAGCPMPAPDGCSPGSRRCHEDTPQVCSPGQRWTPSDVTCSTVNASCVVHAGVPACLRGEP